MRRLNLFTLVVLVPLIVAICFAGWRRQTDLRRIESLEMFDRAIESGDLLPFGRMVTDLGVSEATKHFERAAESKLVTFDGNTRLAQIQTDGLTYPAGSLDLLLLHDFTARYQTAVQQPPVGTVIDSVVFAGDGVDISLHGELLIDGSTIVIPSSRPEIYHLTWIPGAPPSGPPLQSLIEKRKRP